MQATKSSMHYIKQMIILYGAICSAFLRLKLLKGSAVKNSVGNNHGFWGSLLCKPVPLVHHPVARMHQCLMKVLSMLVLVNSVKSLFATSMMVRPPRRAAPLLCNSSLTSLKRWRPGVPGTTDSCLALILVPN